ncbi:MAG: RNA pseudouridine synthase [Deltaproteobacteria bacterium]|nr:RNA pseudouridine synthase [Deltaproteobacteria bacterium]
MAVEILFDNRYFVAVDKPAGWLTVPGRSGDTDLRPILGRVLEAEIKARLFPVHRLDAEVSGLVLFAKDAEAHKAANRWFERGTVAKVYEALTDGDPAGLTAGAPVVWRSRLLRGKKRAYDSPHGKLAVTRATFLGVESGALVWTLEPQTGRPHQLRWHLAQRGYPILGDTLYGSRLKLATGGIALRAVSIDLTDCLDRAAFALPDRLRAQQRCRNGAPVL